MLYVNKEVCIGGSWFLLETKEIKGMDDLFTELSGAYADPIRTMGSVLTALLRKFHGETIKEEATFSLRNLLAFAKAWGKHHRNPNKDFGCFLFDFLSQIDEDVMADLKEKYLVDSFRAIIFRV